MCPKRQFISLYYDKEVPSPWKEKIEAHLPDCPECSAALAEYAYFGEGLDRVPEKVVAEAKDRVWEKLNKQELLSSDFEERRIISRTKARNWNITMPIPVAAAAMLVIIASLVLVGVSTVNRPPVQDQMATATIAVDDPGIVPVADIREIIQYLSSQGLGDFIVIQLPVETPSFSRTGEPVLINAAHQPRRSNIRW